VDVFLTLNDATKKYPVLLAKSMALIKDVHSFKINGKFEKIYFELNN
jgi:hypothetical protein